MVGVSMAPLTKGFFRISSPKKAFMQILLTNLVADEQWWAVSMTPLTKYNRTTVGSNLLILLIVNSAEWVYLQQ
jgi:hypothetical protein